MPAYSWELVTLTTIKELTKSEISGHLTTQGRLHADHVSANSLNDLIVESIQELKGKNICKLDLTLLDDAPTEYFIICEGESTTQVKAIAENIYSTVKERIGTIPAHKEGLEGSRWVLVDYFSTVVHIFHPQARSFYEIEELWSDANFTEYNNL